MAGLSDFNLSGNSQSSSVDETLGSTGLKDLMKDSLLDEVGKARVLESQLHGLNQAQPHSQLDILKSPGSLATLIAGIAAAASGKPEARAAGMGAIMGTLQQAQVVNEAERTQLSKAREQATDALDKSLDRQDKIRNRMATIYNTNPEAFQGPGGEAPDPVALGWYLTGSTNFPIWTNTRRVLNERRESWGKQTDVLMEGLKNAPDAAAARTLTGAMLSHLDMKNPDPALVESLVQAYGTPKEDNELWKAYMTHFGISARDAMMFAVQNNLGPKDPQVLRFLKPDPSQAKGALDYEAQRQQLAALEVARKWERANPEKVLKINAEAKTPEEAARIRIRTAFDSMTPEDLSAVGLSQVDAEKVIDLNNIESQEGDDMNMLYRILGNVQGRDDVMNLMVENKLLEKIGITKEQLTDMQHETAIAEKKSLEQGAADSDASWTARQSNDVAATMAEQAPGFGASSYLRYSNELIKQASNDKLLVELGIQPAKKNADGTIPRSEMERIIKQLTPFAVQDLRDSKK